MAKNKPFAVTVRPIGLSLAHLLFKSGVDRLEHAYRAIIEPLKDTKTRAEELARQALGLNPGELPPEVITEEDGSSSPDFYDEVYTVEYEAEQISSLIRETFLISLFHFWERQSNLWIGVRGETYNHVRVMDWLRIHGYTPNDGAIKKLELAAHCTKHGPGKACDGLRALDPSFFSPPIPPSMGSSSQVQTTIAILDDFFVAVRQSGPIEKLLGHAAG